MTPSRVQRVLGALVDQEAVDFAVVTCQAGDALAEAGDVPEERRWDVPKGVVRESAGFGFRTLVEVGDGKILHVGTTQRLPVPEVRALRSVVASAT